MQLYINTHAHKSHINPMILTIGNNKNIFFLNNSIGRLTLSSSMLIAPMEMPKLRVKVNDKTAKKLQSSSEQLWPGHGKLGVNRLVRDSLKKYVRYCYDKP